MSYFLLNIALALSWGALTGNFDPPNLLTGFVLGYGALFVIRRALEPSDYFVKVWQVIRFVLFFLWELLIANLRVAYDVLTPGFHMQPRVIGIPLDARTDAEIMALTYFINLTPGSVVLDVSTDRSTMFVHVMYAPDADAMRREIKEGGERRILRLMRGTQAKEG
jgi:multicomponent Na+:H+ antiporter subunit E